MDNKALNARLLDIFNRLYDSFGPQHWWPGDGPFEMMVGAVLTQSAAWTNVKKAIANLKGAGILSPDELRHTEIAEIAALIRPAVYFNVKARKLKALVEWFGEECGDDISNLEKWNTDELRERLLSVWGTGEETADSIVLYAAGRPIFVIDAYTRRIVDRIGLTTAGKKYTDYQNLFMDSLPPETRLFNEYHALLVRLGKDYCHSRKPRCEECCLKEVCAFGMVEYEGG